MKVRLFFSGFCFALSATLWLDLLGLSARLEPSLHDLGRFFVAPLFLVVGLLVFASVVFEDVGPAIFRTRRNPTEESWRPTPPRRR